MTIFRTCLRILGVAALALIIARPGTSGAASDLARVEAYLDGLDQFRAEFTQYAPGGQVSRGKLYMKRPDSLRLEYAPPETLLVVGDDGWLTLYDRELEQADRIQTRDTPAGILLRDRIDFSDDVTLRRLSREGGLLRVTLQNAEQPEAGFLTLIFEDDPLILRQWTVRDPQGLETTVVLESLDRGADLDPALFKFDAPLWTDR